MAVIGNYFALVDPVEDELHLFAKGSSTRTVCGRRTDWCRHFIHEQDRFCPNCFPEEAR